MFLSGETTSVPDDGTLYRGAEIDKNYSLRRNVLVSVIDFLRQAKPPVRSPERLGPPGARYLHCGRAGCEAHPMPQKKPTAKVQEELVEALHCGDEARAARPPRATSEQPRQARALLGAMLSSPDARVRQAGAFGLGELGGSANAKLLEQQLELEETREDYDAASVAEAITAALGRIEDASARAGLLRRLGRLVAKSPDAGEVGSLARALWRRRHPELLPALREALGRVPSPAAGPLRALQVLLEKTPEALRAWAIDPAVPVGGQDGSARGAGGGRARGAAHGAAAFITIASAVAPTATAERGAASYYCDRLFSLLILHQERALPHSLPRTWADCATQRGRWCQPRPSLCPPCSYRAGVAGFAGGRDPHRGPPAGEPSPR